MHIDALRQRNQEKAAEEAERGPVRSEPDAVPIGEAIEAFHARGDLVLGIPRHQFGRGAVVPEAARWTGIEAFRADVGMDKGIDTRHQSWQVESTAMQLFADAVGADLTLFSTGGSSQNVRVALMAAVAPGETVVMARNGHKSAFAGLVLSGARPVYVDPVYDERWQVAHGVDPAELGRVLDAHPEARAVMVFTFDPAHVTFDVVGLGLTGFAAADWLREHRGVHVELADHRRLMALVTFAHTHTDVDRFVAALTALVHDRRDADRGHIPEVPSPAALRMETVLLPRDAFLGRTEMVPWRQAAGRISAEMIYPYPPGIPITAPGERLTADVVDHLQQLAAAG